MRVNFVVLHILSIIDLRARAIFHRQHSFRCQFIVDSRNLKPPLSFLKIRINNLEEPEMSELLGDLLRVFGFVQKVEFFWQIPFGFVHEPHQTELGKQLRSDNC